ASPGASVGPAPGAPLASTAKPRLDGATYAVRLRELEARVDELKEQIRRSHTRLSLLSDTILSGGAGDARAVRARRRRAVQQARRLGGARRSAADPDLQGLDLSRGSYPPGAAPP